jgi:hypothetical protein
MASSECVVSEPTPIDRYEPTSWSPVDLTAALAGVGVVQPDLFRRSDGLHLLYRGYVHWFQGPPESGKSWAALVAVSEVLSKGGRALYVDYENGAEVIVERLKALGVDERTLVEWLAYVSPEEPLHDRRSGRFGRGNRDLARLLESGSFDLAVIDAVTPSMAMEGLDQNATNDVANWLSLLPKRLAARGPAVVCIDHVVKNPEMRGPYSQGNGYKLGGTTGGTYKFETVHALARAEREPVEGQFKIEVAKDRHGYVRARSHDRKHVGDLYLTAYPDGGVSAHLHPVLSPTPTRTPTSKPPEETLKAIKDELMERPGASGRHLEGAIKGSANAIRSAIRWMDGHELLTIEEDGRAHRHYLTDKGREAVA